MMMEGNMEARRGEKSDGGQRKGRYKGKRGGRGRRKRGVNRESIRGRERRDGVLGEGGGGGVLGSR